MIGLAISALLLLSAVDPAGAEPAPVGGEQVRIEEARAAFRERLSDAQSKGIVFLKGGASPAIPAPARPAQRLRVGDANPITCLTADMLSQTAAIVEVEPSQTIEALQNVLVDGRDGDRGELELQLAAAYLVIGFAEEAAAVASGRKDARAAAIVSLARLMSGAPPVADGAAAYVGCGDFYWTIARVEGMLAGGAVDVSDRDIDFLKSLPQPVAAPIAEALAITALDRGDRRAAARLKEILDRSASSSRRADAAAFIDTALRQPALTPEEMQTALTPIAAEPGPLRDRAIIALAPVLAQAADHDAHLAFDNDLEDAAAGRSSLGAALGLLLAERRERRGDLTGSLRQLAKEHRAGEAKDGAAATAAQRLLAAALHAGGADRRLQALAAIAAEPAVAAPVLNDADFELVVSEFVAVGAAEALDAFLSARGVAPKARRAIVARTLVRAGRFGEAKDIARPDAGDPAIAEILFTANAFEDKSENQSAAQSASYAGRPDLLARLAMRRGDWKAAEADFARIGAAALAEENAERMAIAALANGRAAPPPAALEALQRNGSELPGFFAPAQLQSAASVAENVEREITFIRRRISHE